MIIETWIRHESDVYRNQYYWTARVADFRMAISSCLNKFDVFISSNDENIYHATGFHSFEDARKSCEYWLKIFLTDAIEELEKIKNSEVKDYEK